MGRRALLVERNYLETATFIYSCSAIKLAVLLYLHSAHFHTHPKMTPEPCGQNAEK